MEMGFRYPKYCHGSAMTISKSAATKLYNTAREYDWKLPRADALFYGVLRTIAKLPISLNSRYQTNVAGNPSSSVKHLTKQLKVFEFQRILLASCVYVTRVYVTQCNPLSFCQYCNVNYL